MTDFPTALKAARKVWVWVFLTEEDATWFRVSKAEAIRVVGSWDEKTKGKAEWSLDKGNLFIGH
jgi:hypothetical protein